MKSQQTSLSPRERVALVLNHQEADRVPIDLNGWATYFTEGAYRSLTRHLGIDEEPVISDWFLVSSVNEKILTDFGVDFRRVALGAPAGFQKKIQPEGTWIDEWGISNRKVGHYSSRLGHTVYYNEMICPPLAQASIDDLETYPWPDPEDPGRYHGLREHTESLFQNTQYSLVASAIGMGLFEQALFLRGLENFLADLLVNQAFALRLVEKILKFQTAVLSRYLDIVGPYVQMVETSDDYGSQNGPLISPALYRELLQPAHRKLLDTIKSRTRAKIYLHSCGSIAALLDDLINAGVDVINPVQPQARDMDSLQLKQRFGSRVVFHGGVDEQRVLPYGTVREVEQEVRRRLQAFAPGGGYILAPAHNLQDDVPPENVVAMYEAAQRYGRYPLQF